MKRTLIILMAMGASRVLAAGASVSNSALGVYDEQTFVLRTTSMSFAGAGVTVSTPVAVTTPTPGVVVTILGGGGGFDSFVTTASGSIDEWKLFKGTASGSIQEWRLFKTTGSDSIEGFRMFIATFNATTGEPGFGLFVATADLILSAFTAFNSTFPPKN